MERPPLNVEPEDIPLDVVYEDSSLIVINKPAGLVVHPAPGSPNGTLVNAVLHHCNLPGLSNTAIHVLDKEEEWGALSKSSNSSDEEEEEEEVSEEKQWNINCQGNDLSQYFCIDFVSIFAISLIMTISLWIIE